MPETASEIPSAPAYLLAGQASELERLQLQSRVWEPAARDLLRALALPTDARALDVGCGAMGWLRVLAERLGPDGQVTGSDIDDRMLAAAASFVQSEGLAQANLVKDDLFNSRLPAHSFDLVHARFQIAPLGRADQQVAACFDRLKPGGWLVLEDPDAASWRVSPDAPATQQLIDAILRAFELGGGDFNAGRRLPGLLRQVGIEPRLRAQVVALEPGHPYLRLPLQFATALRPRLEQMMAPETLDTLMRASEAELARPGTWGTTFTLIQAFGQSPQ